MMNNGLWLCSGVDAGAHLAGTDQAGTNQAEMNQTVTVALIGCQYA